MDSIIQDTPISGSFLSDHATVLFNLKGSKSESSAKEVWFRKIKSINLPKFKNDIRTSELLLNTPNHLVDLVNCFNTTLKSITDKHAPWRKRSTTQRAQAPWWSDEIRSAKRRRRKFYSDFVSSISGDQRKLFAATKKLFNQTADTPFPPHGLVLRPLLLFAV